MIEGKTIAITRSKEDSEEFIELVSQENANPITLPTIELISKGEKIVDEFLETIEKENPDFSIFMSSKAVKLLIESARKSSKFTALQLAIANTIVVAVGPKTREVLENENIKVAHMPERYSSVGVGEVFTRLNAVGKTAIIPRSGASTPFLKNLLENNFINNLLNQISSKSNLNLAEQVEEITCFPIFVSKKVQIPESKNIFLTGDAFYSFPPSFAQGASQSIEAANQLFGNLKDNSCLLYTSPSPRDLSTSRMPSSA